MLPVSEHFMSILLRWLGCSGSDGGGGGFSATTGGEGGGFSATTGAGLGGAEFQTAHPPAAAVAAVKPSPA
jgi:hypothetical protein